MKALILRHREWDRIFAQVKQDYASTPATYLLRTRMVKDLGWTWREHWAWNDSVSAIYDPTNPINDWRDERSQIHIDFYTEEARTFFMLRYLNRDQD